MVSLKKPGFVIILVKTGAPMNQTIEALTAGMEPGDRLLMGKRVVQKYSPIFYNYEENNN